MNNNRGRQIGVKHPEGQGQAISEKAPGTIVGFTPVRLAGVEYVNSKGRVESMLAIITSDDRVYAAPAGGDWFNGCTPVSDRMQDSILSHMPREPKTTIAEPEKADSIDVMGG